MVVDDSSTVKEAPDYYPFGLELPGRTYLSGTGAKEGFTSKERDAETGLDYFGARYYMAALGRWGNVDPLAEHPAQIDKSLYAYAWNNPTNLTDPDGRCPMCVAPAIPWFVTAVEAAIYTAVTVGAAYIGAELLHEVIDGVQMDPGMPSISSADIDAPLVSAPDATGVAIPNITSLNPPVVDDFSHVTADWSLGSHKLVEKWQRQMEQRGWTEQQVSEAIAGGAAYEAVNNVDKAHGAMRYVHPETGRSVVIDSETNEIIHVGGDGFKY